MQTCCNTVYIARSRQYQVLLLQRKFCPAQGVSQIHVLCDPKYIPLCELLGEEDAERLLVFVNTPLSTTGRSRKLTLREDASKEHRTQVISEYSLPL